MDGAFALYEAWLRLQVGDIDSALVVALGRASTGRLAEITPLSLDPYYVAPLSPDPHSLAALQAQAMIADRLITVFSIVDSPIKAVVVFWCTLRRGESENP